MSSRVHTRTQNVKTERKKNKTDYKSLSKSEQVHVRHRLSFPPTFFVKVCTSKRPNHFNSEVYEKKKNFKKECLLPDVQSGRTSGRASNPVATRPSRKLHASAWAQPGLPLRTRQGGGPRLVMGLCMSAAEGHHWRVCGLCTHWRFALSAREPCDPRG